MFEDYENKNVKFCDNKGTKHTFTGAFAVAIAEGMPIE